MAFQKGQSGNPGGKRTEKLIADAMRLAACEEVDGRRKLRIACDKILEKAMGGDIQAFNAVADRIDGKPAQSVEMSGSLAISHEEALDELDDGPRANDQAKVEG